MRKKNVKLKFYYIFFSFPELLEYSGQSFLHNGSPVTVVCVCFVSSVAAVAAFTALEKGSK